MANEEKLQKTLTEVTTRIKNRQKKASKVKKPQESATPGTSIPANPLQNQGNQAPQEDENSAKRKQEIEGMMSNLDNKKRQVKSNEIILANKLKEEKFKLLQNLFKMMEDAGYNPSDLKSIQEFIALLERQDPDLVELFDYAFSGLSSEEGLSPAGPEGPQTDLSMGNPAPGENPIMGRFSNLAQATMMPRNGTSSEPVNPAPRPMPTPAPAPVTPQAGNMPPRQ